MTALLRNERCDDAMALFDGDAVHAKNATSLVLALRCCAKLRLRERGSELCRTVQSTAPELEREPVVRDALLAF